GATGITRARGLASDRPENESARSWSGRSRLRADERVRGLKREACDRGASCLDLASDPSARGATQDPTLYSIASGLLNIWRQARAPAPRPQYSQVPFLTGPMGTQVAK